MTDSMELAILQRLAKVERQNQLLRRVCFVAAILLSALVLMGQAHQNRALEAERFVLKDAAGLTRGILDASDATEGNALLTLYGPQGGKAKGTMAEIGTGPEGPFVLLIDGQKNVVKLSAGNGDQSLSFSDASGTLLAKLTSDPGSGAGALFFQTPNKQVEAFITALPFNSTAILNGDKSSLRLDGNSLEVKDSDGFSTRIGKTQLVTTSTGEKHTTSAASIVLFGKEGKTIWSAP
jgi:hypothetical protein